jgi:predicted component of type VI protein secretion system
MYQKASLFFIMPYASIIAGNINLTETCFEIILQEKVQIKKKFASVVKTYLDKTPDLGTVTLGLDSSLGHDIIDGNPQLLIEIGPLFESDSLLNFLFGLNRKLVDWLIALFIQADLMTCVQIVLKEQDEAFIMGEKNYESRLGYSTSL